MQWLKDEGFGGVMIWSVDMDDFRGTCGSGKYPLIKSMMKELLDYKVKLEYDGPYENHLRSGKYTTKDRKYLGCFISILYASNLSAQQANCLFQEVNFETFVK